MIARTSGKVTRNSEETPFRKSSRASVKTHLSRDFLLQSERRLQCEYAQLHRSSHCYLSTSTYPRNSPSPPPSVASPDQAALLLLLSRTSTEACPSSAAGSEEDWELLGKAVRLELQDYRR